MLAPDIKHEFGWNNQTFALLIISFRIAYTLGVPQVVFLMRQNFMTIPKEVLEAARLDGCSESRILWRIVVPISKPIIITATLLAVVFGWNNFLWPLIVTNSVEARPLTVGLQVFASTDQGIDWSVICAATLMTSAPLLVGFLLFQRQFVQSFMRAGIR